MTRFSSALLALLLLCGVAEADGDPVRVGHLLEVSIEQLHPTQAAIGFDQVYYKLGRYTAEPKRAFDDYCEVNGQGEARSVGKGAELSNSASFTCEAAVGARTADMKTVVVGPAGRLYLTDGHHGFSTLGEWAGQELKVWVRVTDDFSDSVDLGQFWQRMREARKVWLRGADGEPVEPEQLPTHVGLGDMADDPYRSLVYFARKVGYDKPRSGGVAPEFLEFYWGDWLRGVLPLKGFDLDTRSGYRQAVEAAARLMVALPAEENVGDSGFSARQLGGYRSLDRKELNNAASRKLGYALEYRKTHGTRQ
ncbi:ParB/Srx family N-terminal domain-containing protein [Pseudomonas sp. NPDC089554]|uniref:ParB/Srx family N-terminal domain-containing protein n=1 Tax=Pseudomonas sp. NPDC089554 TaxID=3390653 RepID=UPI003D00E584